MSEDEIPSIAALFQVVFDQKVGYTIAWQRSLPDVDLDGVEYQCLPSGLHGVSEDLVYFVHGSHAGISAFVQEEADQQHRNASFVAVGALVSREHSRLGRSWIHAEALRELSKKVVTGGSDVGMLEQFWERNRDGSSTPTREPESPNDKRKRTPSDASDYWRAEQKMEPNHPALSLSNLFRTFGPLTFPLHRAALLQQRVLFIGHAPVLPACNYVYDLSVLSSLAGSLDETATAKANKHRLEPLYNVGVFDITRLQNQETGWIACTTDDILGEKKQLYDLLVDLPSRPRIWPELRKADGTVIKATQRDFRRYTSLREHIKRFRGRVQEGMRYQDHEHRCDEEDDELARLIPPAPSVPGAYLQYPHGTMVEVKEPESWTASAYRSLMWWSSAGEMEAWEAEEASLDQALLNGLSDSDSSAGVGIDESQEAWEMAVTLVNFFHHLTASMLQTLARIAEGADGENEEGIEEDSILISADGMRRMGLDIWSAGDRSFAVDAMSSFFNRNATIEDQGLSMCGVRIC